MHTPTTKKSCERVRTHFTLCMQIRDFFQTIIFFILTQDYEPSNTKESNVSKYM